ncbi:MAG: hypothetical protein ACYSR8_11320 [Planctomycetota bacterium]|jgi:hypothetical protein
MEPKERSSDKAAQEMIARMAEAGQQNAWDRLETQLPQCGFGYAAEFAPWDRVESLRRHLWVFVAPMQIPLWPAIFSG